MNDDSSIPTPICSSTPFPAPKLKSRPSVYRGRIICQICFGSTTTKNISRGKFEKISNVSNFESFAERWQAYEHEYSNVYKSVDFLNLSCKYAHKSCKGKFLKESFLQSQRKKETITPNQSTESYDVSYNSSNEVVNDSIRKSNRHTLKYSSSKEYKICIVCNEQKYCKGRLIPLLDITLQDQSSKSHRAEKTLVEYANIHIKNNNAKYVDGAKRILLTVSSKSLFAADVAYHKLCYDSFRATWWKRDKDETCKNKTNIDEKSLSELFHLVEHHIIHNREIYLMSQLTKFHNQLNVQDTATRSIDLKAKLTEYFGDKLKFIRPSYLSNANTSEYVLASDEDIVGDCVNAVTLGEGIEKSVTLRNMALLISDEIKSIKQKPWPPCPQDIIKDSDSLNRTLYNLIAFIASPNASYDSDGIVKLSTTKSIKVTKLCQDIESLVPTMKPSFSQILLSLNTYHKTGSTTIVNDLHHFGHGISYTEAKFIEDKWAEWSSKQLTYIPSNICKEVETVHVVDNIDWKNKNISGKETHNTNSILIQYTSSKSLSGPNIELKPDYNFSRRDHKSFKADTVQLKNVTFKRSQCKKLGYQFDESKEQYDHSIKKNEAWILSRINDNCPTDQKVPSWSAFQQLLHNAISIQKANVGFLPAITAPPTQFNVIFEVIDRTLNIMKELNLEYIFLEVDQAIYTKVLDVMFKLENDGKNIFDKVIVRMGGFHVIICLLRTIYSRFKDCGIIELLSSAGLGGETSITYALKGGNVKLAIHLHKKLYEAFMRTKINYLLRTDDETKLNMELLETKINLMRENISETNFQDLLSQYEDHPLPKLKGDMAEWIESYIEMINLLLNVIHFQRTGNWEGYLQCLNEFLPYCFACNRHNYARNLSFYYMHMLNLKYDNPNVQHFLTEKGFTASLTGNAHTKIPMDQIIEMTINRASKDTGGLSGKTENADACEKWTRINHFLAALREHQNEITRQHRVPKHIELGSRRIIKDETDVKMIENCMLTWLPNLWEPTQSLTNFATGQQAPSEMIENFKTINVRGTAALKEFLSRFTTNSASNSQPNKNYYDPIKRQKLVTFESSKTKVKPKSVTEDEKQSFTEILSMFESKTLNLKYIIEWPVTKKPYAICKEDGNSRSSQKSLFRNKLQLMCPISPCNEMPNDIDVCVVDAMRVVRIIPISGLTTFLTWTEQIIKYLDNLPGDILHIVFDDYSTDTQSVYLSKNRAEKMSERNISSLDQKLPKSNEWQRFLSNQKNKLQITLLIANFICDNNCFPNKDVYITKQEKCYRKDKNTLPELITDLTSNHKEADQRIAYHSLYLSENGCSKICIVADDTDVYILSLFVASQCNSIILFRQGTGSSKQGITYHNVTSLAHELGGDVCNILPNFHALTGSDYTNPFFKRSKIQAFKKMISKPDIYPKLLATLSTPGGNLEEVTDFVLHVIYNRPCSEKSPGDSRYAMLFKGKKNSRLFNSLQTLPPDVKSLKMKIMRANYITYVMTSCLKPIFLELNPLDYGWVLENGSCIPKWYTGASLPSNEEIEKESGQNDYEVDHVNEELRSESESSDDEIYDNVSENDISSDSDID